MAGYTSPITLAEASELPTAMALLQEAFKEEIAMLAWVRDSVPALIRKYVGLRAKSGTASR